MILKADSDTDSEHFSRSAAKLHGTVCSPEGQSLSRSHGHRL
jgi:hypothetical protein